MNLQEIFNGSSVPVGWIADSHSKMEARFEVGSTKYLFGAGEMYGVWWFNFIHENSIVPTNEHKQLQVFAAIRECIKRVITTKKVDTFAIEGATHSHIRIYLQMIRRLLPSWTIDESLLCYDCLVANRDGPVTPDILKIVRDAF